MKTILMAINRGVVARNILRAGVLDILLKDEKLKIVIAINTKIRDYFKAEFSHPRIILVEVKPKKNSNMRRYWHIITHGLVYTETQHRMFKWGSRSKKALSGPRYFLTHILFLTISHLTFLKHVARFVENKILIERDYDYLFETYKPDLVFCGSIYSHGFDFVLIKAAKRLGVRSISMAKSWDTIGRLFFTAPSDIFIINNELMRERMVKEQLIPKEKVYVSGFPQFDIYVQKKEYTPRNLFLQSIGLDPKKKTVLFASEGEWTNWDHLYLKDFIENFQLLNEYNLILRPHPSDIQKKRYLEFEGMSGIYIDDKHLSVTNMFGDKWDPTIVDMEWMAEIIKNSDVVVTFASTFTLDAFVFDKPVVNLFYDIPGKESLIPMSSIYNTVHYNSILDEKAVAETWSARETVAQVQYYMADPSIQREERKRVVSKICYKIDGKASERIAKVILDTLYKKHV